MALGAAAPWAALVHARPGSRQTESVPPHLHTLPFFTTRPTKSMLQAQLLQLKSHSPHPASGSALGCTQSWAESRSRGRLQPGQAHETRHKGTLPAPSATLPTQKGLLAVSSVTVVTQMHQHHGALATTPLSLDVCLLPVLPLQPSTSWCRPPAFPSTPPLPE